MIGRRGVLAGLALLAAPVARSHSWYDPACCGGHDCSPIPGSAVKASRAGYSVTIRPGEHPLVKDAPVSGFVAYADARPSQDSEFHACIVGGAIKCLYAPQGGV